MSNSEQIAVGERLLYVIEVARYLGIQPGSLYNLHYKGKGPKRIKVGKLIRYREADVLQYVKDNEVKYQ